MLKHWYDFAFEFGCLCGDVIIMGITLLTS